MWGSFSQWCNEQAFLSTDNIYLYKWLNIFTCFYLKPVLPVQQWQVERWWLWLCCWQTRWNRQGRQWSGSQLQQGELQPKAGGGLQSRRRGQIPVGCREVWVSGQRSNKIIINQSRELDQNKQRVTALRPQKKEKTWLVLSIESNKKKTSKQ